MVRVKNTPRRYYKSRGAINEQSSSSRQFREITVPTSSQQRQLMQKLIMEIVKLKQKIAQLETENKNMNERLQKWVSLFKNKKALLHVCKRILRENPSFLRYLSEG